MRTICLLLLALPFLAHAADTPVAPSAPAAKKPEVYKWVDDKGIVHYTDKPPTQDATPAKLPPLQTYKRGTAPDLKKYAPGSSPGSPITSVGPQIQVVTPSKEETFRSGERTVPVAVLVTPAMDPGYKLLYLLDGKAAGPATPDTSFAITEVDRGTHQVAVAVVDESGQELSRSQPVTFYMMPPTAHK